MRRIPVPSFPSPLPSPLPLLALTPHSPLTPGAKTDYTGAASEEGAPGAEGTNVNVPLPLGTDDDAYVEALERAVDRVRDWGPEVLVVSCVAHAPPSSLLTPPPSLSRSGQARAHRPEPDLTRPTNPRARARAASASTPSVATR